MQIDETVTVFTDDFGRPAGFTWRNQNYLVSEDPIRWFSRRNWWVEATSVQRGVGSAVLEVEVWRLVAQAMLQAEVDQVSQSSGFELVHQNKPDQTDQWQLLRVLDES